MNTQFRFITDLLPRIDGEVVPDITFEVAFSNHKPVERAETHKVERLDPMDSTYSRPAAVKGLANTGPTSISINIQSADSLSEEQQAAERARKQAHLAANAMPSWYTKSTVTGETIQGMETSLPGDKLTKEEEDEKKRIRDAEAERLAKEKEDADLQAVFARIKAEEEARQAAGDDESDDEDDDDEFEDIVGTSTNTGAATRLSGAALGAAPVAPSPLRQSGTQPPNGLKREAPDSGPTTGAASPNVTTQVDDERPVKKIKMDDETAAPAPGAAEDDEDDEDDIEFEDV
jgi:transcription initiation factor TFIIE subunit alpha